MMAVGDIVAVTGGGQDETGRLVLNVLTRSGAQGVLPVTDRAATELCYCIPLALLGKRIRGTA